MTTYLYRYDDSYTCDNGLCPTLRKYQIVKETKSGVWIDIGTRHRFVLQTAYKQFALPSIELARESYKCRKQKQAMIYQARLATLTTAITRMETWFNKSKEAELASAMTPYLE